MEQAKSASKAEDYIRYTTRKDVKQRDIKTDEQGRIIVDKRVSKTINHVELANTFIKLSGIVPMSPISRKIIQMKLINPGISVTGISLQTGLLAGEIAAYEKEGINRITDYMRKTDISEASQKANRDNAVNEAVKNLNMQGDKNSLINPSNP